MSRREVLVFFAVVAAAIGLLPFVGGAVAWTHPLWTDEWCCTVYPTQGAPTPFHVIANVAQPQDYAPPLLHVIVWTVGKVTGGIGPVSLRSVALGGVVLGLWFLYAGLRRRFDLWASAAATLAVASHPLVIQYAFEGRFYGPWIGFAAFYAWSLGHSRRWVQALASVFVVTIHWFGIISLGVMLAAAFASYGRNWRTAVRALAPSGVGFAVLAAHIPMVLAQRAGSSAFLWVQPLSMAQVRGMADVFFLTRVPLVAAALVIVVLAVQQRRPTRPEPIRVSAIAAVRDPSIAALVGLALVPLGLVFVSVVLQPSMIARYGIVTVLSVAPLVALAVQELPRLAKPIALVPLLLLTTQNAQRQTTNWHRFSIGVEAMKHNYDAVARAGVPVVFPSLHSMYLVLGDSRFVETPARMLDLPDSSIAALYPSERLDWLRAQTRVEVASGVSHSRVYGFPQVISQAALDTTRLFALFANDLRIPGGARQSEFWGAIVFPHHRVVRVDDHVSYFELRSESRDVGNRE